jgi:hypothetical protein
VKHQHYLYWFATDPEFCAAFARAEKLCGYLIEEEILRRGLEGIDKPVFWQGQQVATVKDYDTTLLIFTAKGNMQEKYGQLGTVTHDTSPQLTALLGYWTQIRQEAMVEASEGRAADAGEADGDEDERMPPMDDPEEHC